MSAKMFGLGRHVENDEHSLTEFLGEDDIKPNKRIEVLKAFYVNVKRSVSMSNVDLKTKNFTEDMKGQWVTEQFILAAKTLAVSEFVVPISRGGTEVPKIQEIDVYVQAFRKSKMETMTELQDVIDMRSHYVRMLRGKLKKKRETLDQAQDEVNKSEEEKANLRLSFEDNDEVDSYESDYRKWQKEALALQQDKQKIVDWEEKCRKDANEQHNEDQDALSRMILAISDLKAFLDKLMRKVPEVEDYVRNKGEDDCDPFDGGDMRQCLDNLLDRYRRDDKMGVLTTIMAGMKETQAKSQELTSFFRTIENWIMELTRLNVNEISIKDMGAIIYLQGMHEKYRKEFLNQQNIMEITLEDRDDGSLDGRSARTDQSLFRKVRTFTKGIADQQLVNQKLNNHKSVMAERTGNGAQGKNAQEAQKTSEAHNAFSIENARAKGICFQFAKTGKCDREGCIFAHGDTDKKVSQGICYSWQNTKTCPKGDACRYKHEETKSSGDEKKDSQSKSKKSGDKKASTNIFSLLEEDGSGDEEERTCCVIVKRSQREPDTSVYSVKDSSKKPIYLGWDSMASINVANSMDIIPGAQPMAYKKMAHGLGGERCITHMGRSPLFGLEMKLIEGGETPNLASVASQLQADADGETGVAIFTSKGAVRIRASSDMHSALAKFVDKAQERGRLEGEAKVRNGVYLEKFEWEDNVQQSVAQGTDSGSVDHACAVTSMYAHRVPLSTEDEVVGMLASAGVTEAALVKGIQNKTIAGLPVTVTTAHVKGYFQKIGKDKDLLLADIHTAVPHKQLGYVPDKTDVPGEIMQIDNVDPSFSRLVGEKMMIRSIGGYRDAVVGIDYATGFSHIEGRVTKKNPEQVLHKFIKVWIAQWQALKLVKGDKEFVTVASKAICIEERVEIRMAVPQDHKRGLAMAEGFIRWLQDMAQGSLNRLIYLVETKRITELQRKSLWYHALRLASIVSNMKMSMCDPTKTRWEEGYGEVFNLAHIVILPFGLPVISRRLHSGSDGRGEEGIYIGPSVVVKGGVLVFNLRTGRVSQKYTFLPREEMPTLDDLDVQHAVKTVYGQLTTESNTDAVPDGTPLAIAANDVRGEVKTEVEEEDDGAKEEDAEAEVEDATTDEAVNEEIVKEKHKHFTRSKGALVLNVMDRPAKPQLPGRQKRKNDPRWKKASKKEQQKLLDEEVFNELPRDQSGEYVLPDGYLILRLFEIHEFKWKLDPETNEMVWLECARIVMDGSEDKREGEMTYAETPDRTVLMLMISIGATTGEVDMTADAVRAYLNALSIDRNIVVISPPELEMLPKLSMLHKGLYGSTKGALSFQVWVDDKLSNIGYSKCQSARSVYIKKGSSTVRLLRHSDDFRISTSNEDDLIAECKLLSESIRLSEFKPTKRFLGVTVERISHLTGKDDPLGKVVLLRMTEKIEEMEVRFKDLHEQYNNKGRIRRTGLPSNPIRDDEELGAAYSMRLCVKGIKRFMALVGLLQWITAGVRFDCRFSYYVVAIRLSKPREWDMYLCVWLMDYIIGTKHRPLVLGGPVVDPETMCDSSYGTLPERRTVKSHVCTTCNGSGAIYVSVGAVKNTIKSIWEGELMAASDGSDSQLYIDKVVKELEYVSQSSKRVAIDSQSVLDWIDSDQNNKHSRHVDIRLYSARHRAKDGSINWGYVNTMVNIADILTKSLSAAQFEFLAGKIMGHDLVAVLDIVGLVNSGEEGALRYKELWNT